MIPGRVFSTPPLACQAAHENDRRWLSFDLLCGWVGCSHPAWHAVQVLRAERADIRAVTARSLLGAVDRGSMLGKRRGRYSLGAWDARAKSASPKPAASTDPPWPRLAGGGAATGSTTLQEGFPTLADTTHPIHDSRRLAWAGAILGFSLGGFFDGILLHQVLQWHHLFSLVPGEMWRDIRNQILMDGWFHVLHYAIALVGLWLLWTARVGFAGSGADRRLLGAALLGFSAWQFVDVVLFHWILMIHRIRVGVPNPLAYDLGWLVAFGVTTLCAGLWLWRGHGGAGGRGRRAAAGLAAVVMLAGLAAAIPAPSAATLVLFRANADPADAFAAVAALDARVLWASPAGDLMAITPAPHSGAWRLAWQLYAHGALVVGSTPALGGCLAWTRS